ncbi:MAG: SDR family oxidoreductase [Thermoleophilaceae bacterium]
MTVHQGNVGNTDDCARVVKEVLDEHGQIDILVNNAGITADEADPQDERGGGVAEGPEREPLRRLPHVEKDVLEHMIERGSGRIVNLSSVVGQMGNIGQANLRRGEVGALRPGQTLAREAAQALGKADKLRAGGVGLTVNTVAPGFIATDMTKDLPEKVVEKIKGQIPAGRLGHPDEWPVVHFLCSDSSGYITGQVWGVNGGMDM